MSGMEVEKGQRKRWWSGGVLRGGEEGRLFLWRERYEGKEIIGQTNLREDQSWKVRCRTTDVHTLIAVTECSELSRTLFFCILNPLVMFDLNLWKKESMKTLLTRNWRLLWPLVFSYCGSGQRLAGHLVSVFGLELLPLLWEILHDFYRTILCMISFDLVLQRA